MLEQKIKSRRRSLPEKSRCLEKEIKAQEYLPVVMSESVINARKLAQVSTILKKAYRSVRRQQIREQRRDLYDIHHLFWSRAVFEQVGPKTETLWRKYRVKILLNAHNDLNFYLKPMLVLQEDRIFIGQSETEIFLWEIEDISKAILADGNNKDLGPSKLIRQLINVLSSLIKKGYCEIRTTRGGEFIHFNDSQLLLMDEMRENIILQRDFINENTVYKANTKYDKVTRNRKTRAQQAKDIKKNAEEAFRQSPYLYSRSKNKVTAKR